MPTPKLDRIDRRILEEIQADGSISNLELSERIGLSPSPCARRIKILQETGIINRQITLLDQDKLGLPISIYVMVCLENQESERLENFDRNVSAWPEVLECSLITGSDADYLLKVVMPDMDYYQRFLLKKLNRIDGIRSIKTSFVLRKIVQRTELPLDHIK
ncbi:MAG: Lrp/AsnC family leucine-responsive transcriptional regulator [Porticoccaceae bacterium]|jgi:Lrp/AsnC family leucine-responsive transcriptional regulator|nr:Lrp/AsnC family transcriptional regulator [SAR92 clade bacterium]|tara:strand:+ start:1295 stop:1777 length:483 start_codon:yes stop_codon:yes gene_type:complete